MNAALLPYADPEILAMVERLRDAGAPTGAAERYAEADAEYSRLLREALA